MRSQTGNHKTEIGVAIIHLVQLLPVGSSDLPGGRSSFTASGGQPFLTPPYLVLHCEEFAWPRMSPHAPVRSYIKPLRAAPFHPSPAAAFRRPDRRSGCSTGACKQAGLFSVALVVAPKSRRSEISNLRLCWNAPPLAGSLPFSVRTFLSWRVTPKSEIKPEKRQQRPPDLFSCKAGKSIANLCSTRIAHAVRVFNPGWRVAPVLEQTVSTSAR